MAGDAEGVFAAGDPNPEQTNPEPTSNPEPVAEEKPKESKKKPKKEADSLQAPTREAAPVIDEVLTARSIRLVSPSGKSTVVLQARDDMAGLWINASPDGDRYPRSCISLYDAKDTGPVIGFHRDTGEESGMALHFAICLDEHGIPQLQVDNGRGGYGFIGLAALLDHLKPDWR